MKLWVVIVMCALAALAVAQDAAKPGQEGKIKVKPEGDVSKEILLHSEMNLNLVRLESAIDKVLSLKTKSARKAPPEAELAKRETLVMELTRLVNLTKLKYTFTPRPVEFNRNTIQFPSSSPQRKNLEMLIRLGFISRVAPLVTGKDETLTLGEFGHLVGVFISRLSELTHKPSTRWSPYLMDPN